MSMTKANVDDYNILLGLAREKDLRTKVLEFRNYLANPKDAALNIIHGEIIISLNSPVGFYLSLRVVE